MDFFQIILQILTLAGALVLFLYGMKIMSESLQKLAGHNMRKILAKITSRPGRGVLTGFLITAIIQSSSATTVMLVSFVNAGLISFTQSIGIIFGANIGTTVTAWLISLLGFNTHFSLYSIMLPVIALSLPLFFSYNNRNKTKAEFIIGFALLFIGIFFFRENIPVINENSEFFQNLQFFDNSFINILMFIGLGILITVIFQSSSATITLTMVLASQGWLSFSAALAMVIGENIGTAATANFAAIVANRSAKRTALAHLLFNVLGMLWILPFLGLITSSLQNALNGISNSAVSQIVFGISIFHTGFNVANAIVLTLLFIPFKKLCLKLLPIGNELKEIFSLKFIDNNLLSTSELSILQAKNEIAYMGKRVTILFSMIPDLLLEKKEKKFAKIFDEIQKSEEIIDEMEIEIAEYISKIHVTDLSNKGTQRTQAMFQIIDLLESIGDVCYQMSLTISKKNEAKAWFTQELRNNLFMEFDLIEKSLNLMVENLAMDYVDVDINDLRNIETGITETRNELKKSHSEKTNSEKFPYKTGIYYNDLLTLSVKISDLAYKVVNTMYKQTQ